MLVALRGLPGTMPAGLWLFLSVRQEGPFGDSRRISRKLILGYLSNTHACPPSSFEFLFQLKYDGQILIRIILFRMQCKALWVMHR